MEGLFPVKNGKSTKERRVLVAYIDRHTAGTIPWKHWGRDKEGRLWSLLPYKYRDPRFA
jgi:hypothetical protein